MDREKSTIFDLEKQIKERMKKDLGKDALGEIDFLKSKREKQKQHNYKMGAYKRKINKIIKSSKSTKTEKKQAEVSLKNIVYFDLKKVDNEIKMAAGKDFSFGLNTKFGSHKIKASELLKKKNIPEFISKLVKKDLEKAKSKEPNKVYSRLEKKVQNNILMSKGVDQDDLEYLEGEEEGSEVMPMTSEIIVDQIMIDL